MAAAQDTTTGRSPAFQFYAQDFTAGTLTLSTEEVGAYILLMCHCWDKGSIPSDNTLLSRIARLTPQRMRKVWIALLPKFQPSPDGGYIQPRIELERKKQAEYRRRQSDASRKRWESHGIQAASPSVVPTDKPDASSSVSGLQSSDFSQHPRKEREGVSRATIGAGVMAGALPRDHVNCRPPCIRVCLSERQHAVLKARHGGDDAALDAFYAEVRANLSPNVPIGDTPWKFWDAQFAAKFGTVAPPANSKTAGNAAAIANFIARGKRA